LHRGTIVPEIWGAAIDFKAVTLKIAGRLSRAAVSGNGFLITVWHAGQKNRGPASLGIGGKLLLRQGLKKIFKWCDEELKVLLSSVTIAQ
jgi:hypothetical protein